MWLVPSKQTLCNATAPECLRSQGCYISTPKIIASATRFSFNFTEWSSATPDVEITYRWAILRCVTRSLGHESPILDLWIDVFYAKTKVCGEQVWGLMNSGMEKVKPSALQLYPVKEEDRHLHRVCTTFGDQLVRDTCGVHPPFVPFTSLNMTSRHVLSLHFRKFLY